MNKVNAPKTDQNFKKYLWRYCFEALNYKDKIFRNIPIRDTLVGVAKFISDHNSTLKTGFWLVWVSHSEWIYKLVFLFMFLKPGWRVILPVKITLVWILCSSKKIINSLLLNGASFFIKKGKVNHIEWTSFLF